VLTALSRIGQHCARVNIGKDETLIALRAYLDSSGKLEDNYITLAAFSATEEMWKRFETDWDAILEAHTPKAKYVHMREVAHQIKGFDRKFGWNDDNAFGLATECMAYMSNLDKKRFRMFYCVVDLKAWHKLRAETFPLPSPIDLCNEYCARGPMMWYFDRFPEILNLQNDTIKYFFDRGEPFKQPFEDEWIRETKRSEERGVWSVWNLIEQITPVDMKKVPGVQAADILAWSVNRDQTTAAGKKGKMMREVMMKVIPAYSVLWDEAKLRKHFKPLLYLPGTR
jgi:hypothetical protein